MSLGKLNEKAVAVASTEKSLLSDAHELVVNEIFPDLPEALDFLTNQNETKSRMHDLIEEERYEECAKLLQEKSEILNSIAEDEDED